MASTTGDKDQYILLRDSSASSRLFGQHFIMTAKNGGWLLHPNVQATAEKSRARIADVATGNGVWAGEAALKYPDAQIVALDMSDKQYPPGWTMPKNLSFDTYNVLQAVPDKYIGYFDIVHIRLIAGGLKGPADYAVVTENVSKMLKPGGYIQWQDVYAPGWQIIDQTLSFDVDDETFPPFLAKFDEAVSGGITQTLSRGINHILKDNDDFADVEMMVPGVVPWLLKYETDYLAISFAELVKGSRGTRAVGEESLRLLDEAEGLLQEYLGQGGLLTYKTMSVVARKDNGA
ncbi:hypothetical protein EDD37DRAFT_169163 [Exophiala viscosa]|uniref:Methyltransferase domain-containing protein n=1 Tax=Exophiala viscosa TaxID=2486360 RepID=A0AAN6DMF3_9EURO|nr:hypothetical protein EDD36DRAFT_103957 [Exophiala viscosa]KAI1620212.1 hypothetical protein EDD37DRAFT_169163 [Exophiala viscosa]